MLTCMHTSFHSCQWLVHIPCYSRTVSLLYSSPGLLNVHSLFLFLVCSFSPSVFVVYQTHQRPTFKSGDTEGSRSLCFRPFRVSQWQFLEGMTVKANVAERPSSHSTSNDTLSNSFCVDLYTFTGIYLL